jgi:lysophospholipase L1-like esterase
MRILKYLLLTIALLSPVQGRSASPLSWAGTWASSQQIPELQSALLPSDLTDATLRETVHVSQGGAMVRVHLSNVFRTRPLHLTSVHIARPLVSSSRVIDPASDHALLFNGSPDVMIPPAAEYVSDPIAYPLAALSDLTVSMHVEAEPGQQSGHPGSRQTTYYAHGDLTAAADMPSANKVQHWYMLSGVDVQTLPDSYAIVALGDSITDGHGATTNGNDRWTDVLAQRLLANIGTRKAGILNQGIGGNQLLTDGLGPNALARLDRDVLAQASVRYLIVLEGINDLGGVARMEGAAMEAYDQIMHSMIGAYRQIIARAYSHGIKVYGATVMADGGSDYYHPDAASERDRQQANT